MTTPPAMPEVSPKDLEAVLRRSKENDALAVKIAQAIELINGVLDQLSETAVALSFNGGKDCTVLLHLLAAVLYARHTSIPDDLRIESSSIRIPPDNTHSPQPSGSSGSDAKSDEGRQSQSPTRYQPSTSATHHQSQTSSLPYPLIKSIYITAPYPFEEMDNFVLESTSRYGLDLYRFGGGMKAALEEYLGCGGGKGVRGVLVGTRHGDPNGNVEPLAPTDPSWPAFLRVHPILDWSYNEIWQFLREFNVPYCSLYDEGFTSLGSTKNTVPNPHLQRDDGAFDPAWTLQDGSKERAGRNISSA